MLSPGCRLHPPSMRMHGRDQPVRSVSGEGLAAGCCSLIPAAPENHTGPRNVHSGNNAVLQNRERATITSPLPQKPTVSDRLLLPVPLQSQAGYWEAGARERKAPSVR